MIRCAFTPYEGNRPYIFVSYAHKDSDRVFPVLEELDRRGYRIWYDDGIAPGSEWPENIAQHLDGCALCLAFISPASIASANCRREVTFALSKRKPFLGILLEKTEMSLGMEMQLSAQQCIMKYTYRSEEAFYEKICSCPDLKPCLGNPKATPAPKPAPAVIPAPVPVAEKTPSKPTDKKTVAIIAAAAVVLLILGIVLFAVLGGDKPDDSQGGGPSDSQGPSDPTDSGNTEPTMPSEPTEPTQPDEPGSEGYTGEWELEYYDRVITAREAKYICQQKDMHILRLERCIIQPDAFNGLTLPASLRDIYIIGCTGVPGLKDIANMPELVILELVNSGITDDMLPVTVGSKLYRVDISGNPGITDLTLFANCVEMKYFTFSDTGVASVEPMAGMEILEDVYGSGTKVTDLTPLMELTTLRKLYMADCGLETIETLCFSLYLNELDLSHNQLTTLNAFTYCTDLNVVNVAYNDLQNIEILEKNSWLCRLDVSGNGGLYEWDLEFVSKCQGLEELYVDGLFLGTLEFIRDMPALLRLSANNCNISDLSPLESLNGLEYLSLAYNEITDVAPLADVFGDFKMAVWLDLSFNDGLTDVSGLEVRYYEVLNLVNENLDLSTVPAVEGTTMMLVGDGSIAELPHFVEPLFGEYVFVMCPMDQRVAVEKTLGKEKVLFIDKEEDYLLLLQTAGLRYLYLMENAM